MKKIFFGIGITMIIATACNNSRKSSKENDMSKMNADTSKNATVDNMQMAEITHTFNDIDPKLAAALIIIIDHYLHIKNALVSNEGSEAASGGKAMADGMTKIDKSLFTTEQKKLYDGIADDLQEHAEHIGKNSRDIDHQREHFSMMSEDIYDLVKAFGAGRVLYHDHCPMAGDNKGAMWLSEMKEVKNPYFGGKMKDCVKIPEVIK